jgi:hypothetical protein
VRFASRLHFRIDPAVETALTNPAVLVRNFLHHHIHLISHPSCLFFLFTQTALATKVSRERISIELDGILRDAVRHLHALAQGEPLEVSAAEAPLERCVMFGRWLCLPELHRAVFLLPHDCACVRL